jgi:papilin
VDGSAYILGDSNSTVVSAISQPATLRCLAGGYPKPFVTWWRGDKILPLKDEKVEITRDYSLILNKIDLSDLGPYVCQAYNSIGRPVSIQVTLKARGQVHARTEEERKNLQYVETEPLATPTTFRPQTAPPQTQLPRTRPPPYYPPVYNVTVVRPSLGKFFLLVV